MSVSAGYIVPETIQKTFRDFSLIVNEDGWLYSRGNVASANIEKLLNRALSIEEKQALDYHSDNNWDFWPGKVFVLSEDGSLLPQN